MSKTIWKYMLPRNGQTIQINNKIIDVLHIGCQNGYPTAWVVVDPEATCYSTVVVAWGTGWDLPDDVYCNCDYWGTCEDGAGYVWHYFAAARFPDCYAADKATNTWDSDKYTLTGYPLYSAPTITQCDGTNWTLTSVPTEITFTADNTKVNMDALIDMVEKYVGASNTATNSACR